MLRRRIMMKKGEVDYSRQYFTLIALSAGTFNHTEFDVEYSVNGGTWTTLRAGSSTPTVQAGEKVMFRGTITPTTSNGVGTFTGTKNFEAEGNVMSLLYGDNFVGQVDLTGKNYAFYKLFNNTSYLKSAKNLSLPATTLADNCYRNMFSSCTSLTAAPELPATTLANHCYRDMFNGCISLTEAPELPATTLTESCYRSMFYGCTNLTTAPELPATTLASECYRLMFKNCTGLTTVHKLPATTLAKSCYYQMFHSCTSLATVPSDLLPATTLAVDCYEGMFGRCTSLTKAPELPATTLADRCYYSMFYICTSLSSIKCLATDMSATNCTNNWVYGVEYRGTFVKAASATWTAGVSGRPSGWKVVNYI